MRRLKANVIVKSITGIVLLLVIFSVIVGVIGYRKFTVAMAEQYADGGFRTAWAAVNMLDEDRIDEYMASGGKTEEYLEAWSRLDDLCNATGATFIYMIIPERPSYNHITFLFSTINENSEYEKYDFGYVRDTTNDDYRTKYRKLYDKTSDEELVIRDKGVITTGSHITCMVPVISSAGEVEGILCVQRQMDVMYSYRRGFVNDVIITLLILTVFVIIVQGLYLYHVFLQPMKIITDEAIRFAAEDVTKGETLSEKIRNKDEIGLLAGAIDTMEQEIVNYVGEITHITAEKERISTELDMATKIQMSQLPRLFPPYPERREFDLFASTTPAREVGGDFYDFFLVDSDHLALVIADSAGKGIPAALFMMISRILIKNAMMRGMSPAEALTSVNNELMEGNEDGMFVTVWLALLEISTGNGLAVNAGHEHPVLRRAGGNYELVLYRHFPAVAVMENIRFKEHEFHLEPGDSIFVYTDGVAEATDMRQELFGTDRMLEALNRRPDWGPDDAVVQVFDSITRFVAGAEQFDDITMMGFRYNGVMDEKE